MCLLQVDELAVARIASMGFREYYVRHALASCNAEDMHAVLATLGLWGPKTREAAAPATEDPAIAVLVEQVHLRPPHQ